MLFKVLGLIVGYITGSLFNISIIMVNAMLLFPMPEGLTFNDAEGMEAYFSDLPVTAFLMVLLAHAGGTFIAAFVCMSFARGFWGGAIALGVLFTVGSIMNLRLSPALWFSIVDVAIHTPALIGGGWMATQVFGGRPRVIAPPQLPDEAAAEEG